MPPWNFLRGLLSISLYPLLIYHPSAQKSLWVISSPEEKYFLDI